jgi:CRISPR/Cas system CSM-associated protein Csm2 small subunit
MEFKKVVLEAEDMSIEVFCALTNSNMKFMSAVRQFIARVKTNTGMDPVEVQKAMTYTMIIKNFAQISNSSFIRIQELMTYNLNHMFSQLSDHKNFEIEKFLEEIIDGIGPVFSMLVTAYSKKLWKHIHETFSSLFIQFVITYSVKYKKNEQKNLTEKLEREIDIINDFFEGKAGKKDYKENVKKLDDLFQCLVAPSDKVIVNILNLQLKLRDKFNEKCMKCLMRLRGDITDK